MSLVYSSEDYPKQPLVDWDLFSVPQINAGNDGYTMHEEKLLVDLQH